MYTCTYFRRQWFPLYAQVTFNQSIKAVCLKMEKIFKNKMQKHQQEWEIERNRFGNTKINGGEREKAKTVWDFFILQNNIESTQKVVNHITVYHAIQYMKSSSVMPHCNILCWLYAHTLLHNAAFARRSASMNMSTLRKGMLVEECLSVDIN